MNNKNLDNLFLGTKDKDRRKATKEAFGLSDMRLEAQRALQLHQNSMGFDPIHEFFKSLSKSAKEPSRASSMFLETIDRAFESQRSINAMFDAIKLPENSFAFDAVRQYKESTAFLKSPLSQIGLPDFSGLNSITAVISGFESALKSSILSDLVKTCTLIDSINRFPSLDLPFPRLETIDLIEKIIEDNPDIEKEMNSLSKSTEGLKSISSQDPGTQKGRGKQSNYLAIISILLTILYGSFPSIGQYSERVVFSILKKVKQIELRKLEEICQKVGLFMTKTTTLVKDRPHKGSKTILKLTEGAPVNVMNTSGRWCQVEFHFKEKNMRGWCPKKNVYRPETTK